MNFEKHNHPIRLVAVATVWGESTGGEPIYLAIHVHKALIRKMTVPSVSPARAI